MLKHGIPFLLVLIICCQPLLSQVTSDGIPFSKKYELRSNLLNVEIPNKKRLLPVSDKKIPPQAGYTLPVHKNVIKNGIWEETGENYTWRLQLYIPKADRINIYFRNVILGKTEKLYVYEPGYYHIQEFDQIENKNICTDFISNDTIIIEFNTRLSYKELPFDINEVGILISDYQRGFGDAGNCEVHVNCSEGASWKNEKNGVARVLVKEGSFTFWCSGSLINNTRNDGSPLFLTANHCGAESDSTDYSEWMFYFNFESESCGQPVFEPESNTIAGSRLLAKSINSTSNSSDFKLLKLAEDIPLSYNPYYNGWDRTDNPSSSGVTIHHPQGDVKMISTYTQQLVSTRYDNTVENPDGEYWMVYWTDTDNGHGVTEGGSSGSPIFNNEGNIVGALTGGRASCANELAPDFYGKLSYSWEGLNSDSTSNLMYWLDPISLGVSKLKGTNLDSTNVYASFIADPRTLLVGGSTEITNSSYGNINNYSWYFEGGIPEYSELEDPGNIRYNQAGEFDVRLIVNSADGSDTLLAQNYIVVLPNLSPNPSSGKVRLSFGGSVPSDFSIRAFNVLGQETGYKITEIGDNFLVIDLMPLRDGNHLIKFSSSEINNTYKVVIIRN